MTWTRKDPAEAPRGAVAAAAAGARGIGRNRRAPFAVLEDLDGRGRRRRRARGRRRRRDGGRNRNRKCTALPGPHGCGRSLFGHGRRRCGGDRLGRIPSGEAGHEPEEVREREAASRPMNRDSACFDVNETW